ncbi:hypothetical protein [Mycobacteroides saopaulense]|uniref:hypothetical protein n=1 Tax=Mycobacteroides saopaulense TaxID=1578165 RepID=UPI001041E5FA|nr:hypothetical protein [Mycobacteroides saopaulense]
MGEKNATKWPFKNWGIVGGGILVVLGAANSTSWGVEEQERQLPPPIVSESPNLNPANNSPAQCQAQTVPVCDGIFRVAGDQSSTGITTGWISTDGPIPNSQQHCTWLRLSGPEMTVHNTIAAGTVKEGAANVLIKPSDYAFATYGCKPWRKVG